MALSSMKEKIFFGIGSLFIATGIICNEWVLAALFSPDEALEPYTKLKIWFIDLLLVSIGFLLIWFRNRISLPSRINLVFLVFLLLISLVIGEIFMRVFYPEKSPYEKLFHLRIVRKPLPYTMFGGMPNSQFSDTEKLNSKGYRGMEPSLVKNQHEYRIFMLGGSTVFEGKPPIATLLENEFKKNGFTKVKVFNYGVPAGVSGMELSRIVFEIADLSPDLIVMYNGANDILIPLKGDPRPGYPLQFMVFENNPLLVKDINKYPFVSLVMYGSSMLRLFFPSYFLNKFVHLNQLRKDASYNTEEWRNSIVKIYVNNIVKAHKVSNTFGADFIAFFQPVLFFKDSLSAEEYKNVQMAVYQWYEDHFIEMRKKILAELEKTKKNSEVKIIDISDIYDNVSEQVFIDHAHTVQNSKIIVAKEIYKNITNDFGPKIMKATN
jgi:hypothetical protein